MSSLSEMWQLISTLSPAGAVTVTPLLPEGALLSDYTIRWSSTPRVTFTAGGDAEAGQRQFTMPDANISVTCNVELKTYAVKTYNCSADKTNAARGETVTVTDAREIDLESTMIAWSISPAVEFTVVDGCTIAFAMPAERVMVTANRRARAFPITTIGCAADKTEAPCGETVTVTAVLPPEAHASGYDFAWSSMPAEAVSVTCVATEKPPEDTATQRVVWLEPGWNAVVLSLKPDADSVAKLAQFTVMALDAENLVYVHPKSFTANGLYWIFSTQANRLVLTGEPAPAAAPSLQGDWQPFGAYPAVQLDDYDLWQWQRSIFQRPAEPLVKPGCGYFIRSTE